MDVYAIPHVKNINGFSQIVISGVLPSNFQRLAITLADERKISQTEDLALHISIRSLDHGHRLIVMNYRVGSVGVWGRAKMFSLRDLSTDFVLTVKNRGQGYIVRFNAEEYEFEPPNGVFVKCLMIQGDVKLSSVDVKDQSDSFDGLGATFGALAIAVAAGGVAYALLKKPDTDQTSNCGRANCGSRCHCRNCTCADCTFRRSTR